MSLVNRWGIPLAAIAAIIAVAGAAAGSEAASRAPLVVVGRCEAQSADWEGGSIVTTSDVTVLQAVRGVPPVRLRVRQRGGVVDGIGQRVSHVTLLEAGKSYLLFLDDGGGPAAGGVREVETLPDGGQTVDGRPLEDVLAEVGGGR